MQTEETAMQMAARVTNEGLARINTLDHPNYVRSFVGAYHGHMNAAFAAGDQLDADRAELKAKAPFIPAEGRDLLARRALAEAEQKAKKELSGARDSLALLKRAALLGAIPQLSPEREMLARQELALSLGEGNPAKLMTQVAKIAQGQSRDAIGALLSSFGRTILEVRGLEGRDLDDALDSAQRIVVESAADNASRHTEAELKSAALYRATGDLEASISAASFALGHIGISHA